MIGHQASGQQIHWQPRTGFPDQTNKPFVIPRIAKYGCTCIATIDYVVAHPPTDARAVLGMTVPYASTAIRSSLTTYIWI